ncbi:O-antigen ligase family protein [Ancylobacter sp. WKF20]|uniref:O-antigen ligase family protein n=1 Tax=Ancylobacter sp. WKF20 TaxID=3039801 RepID=UPI002434510D|nr:O-antigen ligase family protein [Ancylobacter sp. WKF20]WGD28929.1 O-antigen ligase family protein [Ancylobacter sp. WKF20]
MSALAFILGPLLWMSGLLQVGPAPFMVICLPLMAAPILLMRYNGRHILADGMPVLPLVALFASSFVVLAAVISLIESPEPFRIFRVVLAQAFGLVLVPFFFVAQRLYGSIFCIMFVRRVVLIGVAINMALIIGSQLSSQIAAMFYGSYRFKGFLDGPIQMAILSATPVPFLVSLLLAKNDIKSGSKLITALGVFGLMYSLLASGGKFALGVAPVVSFALFCFVLLRRDGAIAVVKIFGMSVVAFFVVLYVYNSLDSWNPLLYDKINAILFATDIAEYQSVESRMVVWDISIELFLEHPLTGVGAGSMVDGLTHSHNVFLDYARGMGLWGVIGITGVFLCVLTGLVSAAIRFWLRPTGGSIVALGLFLSAALYIILNQMSDSFGLATAPIFWLSAAGGFALLAQPSQPPVRVRPAAPMPVRYRNAVPVARSK